ncbi:MAG: hypothetical protein JRI56_11615 [Deltaproteobacteria bacterium]|nr:hypothetical protein [Deltaproteobacteria bacterium]
MTIYCPKCDEHGELVQMEIEKKCDHRILLGKIIPDNQLETLDPKRIHPHLGKEMARIMTEKIMDKVDKVRQKEKNTRPISGDEKPRYRTLEEQIIDLWRKRGMEVQKIEYEAGTWHISAKPKRKQKQEDTI